MQGVLACLFLHSIKKVEIVNDNFGLRKGTLLHQLPSPNAMRLTENQKSRNRQRRFRMTQGNVQAPTHLCERNTIDKNVLHGAGDADDTGASRFSKGLF